MKPYLHAKNSVSRHGGQWEDYIKIHDFLDSSKAHVPDMRHRVILHSSFGVYIAEQVFGTVIENCDGKVVSVRDVCEEHIMEDMGNIPTVQDYLLEMPFYDWLGGAPKNKTKYPLNIESVPVPNYVEQTVLD